MSQWGLTYIAGMNQISEKQMNEAEKQFKNFESMINSMTLEERSNPDLLAKVIAGPHAPVYCQSVYVLHAQRRPTIQGMQCSQQRGQGLCAVRTSAWAVLLMSSAARLVRHLQTASRRRRIARGAGRTEVDVTNMIGSFSGMRSKMQSLSKMMKMGGGGPMCFPSYHS